MEITKEQIKELVKIAQAIDDENRIDDDVSGGYVEEPYNSIIERIYAVVNECESKEVDTHINNSESSDNSIEKMMLSHDNNSYICSVCETKHKLHELKMAENGLDYSYYCKNCGDVIESNGMYYGK